MDGLRWLLLLFGLLVVAGVYLYSRRQNFRDESDDDAGKRIAPSIGDEPDNESAETDDLPEIEAPDANLPSGDAPQKIVTLRIIARDGGIFRGDELILSLRGIGLRHGKFGIFHRTDGNDESRTIFSAAQCHAG